MENVSPGLIKYQTAHDKSAKINCGERPSSAVTFYLMFVGHVSLCIYTGSSAQTRFLLK